MCLIGIDFIINECRLSHWFVYRTDELYFFTKEIPNIWLSNSMNWKWMALGETWQALIVVWLIATIELRWMMITNLWYTLCRCCCLNSVNFMLCVCQQERDFVLYLYLSFALFSFSHKPSTRPHPFDSHSFDSIRSRMLFVVCLMTFVVRDMCDLLSMK